LQGLNLNFVAPVISIPGRIGRVKQPRVGQVASPIELRKFKGPAAKLTRRDSTPRHFDSLERLDNKVVDDLGRKLKEHQTLNEAEQDIAVRHNGLLSAMTQHAIFLSDPEHGNFKKSNRKNA